MCTVPGFSSPFLADNSLLKFLPQMTALDSAVSAFVPFLISGSHLSGLRAPQQLIELLR